MLDKLCGAILCFCLGFFFFFNVLKKVPIYFRRMLQRCLAVNPQKCFVEDETSPLSTSTRVKGFHFWMNC